MADGTSPRSPGHQRGGVELTILILPYGLKVTSGLPQVLAGIASTIVLARSLFTIAALQLLLVAGAGLVLAARLLASLREEESALLRARGDQVAADPARAGRGGGLGAGPAAGVLAGTGLTGVMASAGPACTWTATRPAASARWPGCRPWPCWCCASR